MRGSVAATRTRVGMEAGAMSMDFIRKAYQLDVKAGDRIEFRDYLGKIKRGTVSRGFGWLLRVRIEGREEPINVHPQNVLRVIKKVLTQ
jgi:hypothetical protein